MNTPKCSVIGCTDQAEWENVASYKPDDYLCQAHWQALHLHLPHTATSYVGLHTPRSSSHPALDRLGNELAYDGGRPSRI